MMVQPEILPHIFGSELQFNKLLSKNVLTWIYNEYEGENSELKQLKKRLRFYQNIIFLMLVPILIILIVPRIF